MPKPRDSLPLNAIRVFVAISREASVTRAAKSLGITQSSASRHLAVLERYLGARLIERRGRLTSLTDFGRLFAEAVGEPLDAVAFAVQRMRRARVERQRIVVRTSLSTFAFSTLIPNLPDFAEEANGVVVDVITSLAAPTTSDSFDVLVTRDLDVAEPSDHWDLFEEHLVCAGPPALIDGEGASALRDRPFLSTTSRPDILPRWLAGMAISQDEITLGACYDHYYLALPAVTTGQGLLVAPEILIADLVRQGILGCWQGRESRAECATGPTRSTAAATRIFPVPFADGWCVCASEGRFRNSTHPAPNIAKVDGFPRVGAWRRLPC